MPKSNAKQNRFHFDESTLAAKGYVQQPDGTFAKSKPATPLLDRLAAREHAEQARALECDPQKKRSRKAGRAKGNRRKRPADIVVTMTAHLPRYFDDDNLANALKPCRDALAEWMQIDDGDRRVMWEHDQTMTRGTPGVCVKIERLIDEA